MKTFYFLILFLPVFSYANPPDYEQRREDYITTALSNQNNDVITLQAYKGLPVDQVVLTGILNRIQTTMDVDFDIVKLVRVLMLSNGEYDSQILPVLDSIPFWLKKDETLRVYWSENHMIMWMSSDWLLHEKYGRAIDSNLYTRLKHFLELKNQYGFYEFFSSVYSPYCLTGLLNMADFSQDPVLKDLAVKASQRLLKDLLMVTNDKGVMFPTAGRNYYGKYATPYGQNHNTLLYMLMGFGRAPRGGSHAGNFLASSTLPVTDVINSWTPNLDIVYNIGHSLTDGLAINSGVDPNDRVIFQWSSGAYFHPTVALSSATLIDNLNLWEHGEFSDFKSFSILPVSLAPSIAEIASPISKSSVICGQNVSIFKNKSVTLSSVHDFWKGKVGYQEFPLAANVDTTAVFTASGKIYSNWEDHAELHANEHLPYISQKKNVALIMYRPEKALAIFGYKDLDVGLHWNNADFAEIRESNKWLLGRVGESYVAVRRNCINEINGIRACENPDGQTWVIVVGNMDMHGSFDNFQNIIEQSQYEERWYFNLPTFEWVYYAKVVVDGKTIEYAWNGNIFSGPTRVTAIDQNRVEQQLKIYPNPADASVQMDISAFYHQPLTIRVFDLEGKEMYTESIKAVLSAYKEINTSTWPQGMYTVTFSSNENHFNKKLVIQR